jgi:ABC-type Fe3+-citrate transport system substrate-binding protein
MEDMAMTNIQKNITVKGSGKVSASLDQIALTMSLEIQERDYEELAKAHDAFTSMIQKTQDVRPKLKTGSPQLSLNTNRLEAFRISQVLILYELGGNAPNESFTKTALGEAMRQLNSLMNKSEKALIKLPSESWQYSLTKANIFACRIATELIAKESLRQ